MARSEAIRAAPGAEAAPLPLSGRHALVSGGGTGIGAAIAGRLAFYPNQVEVYEVSGEDDSQVREAILHTDDGAGQSQREHWRATTDSPRVE